MNFSCLFDERAVLDIKNASEFYKQIEIGLEITFFEDISSCIRLLERNPFFQIRYNSVRCLPLHTFPFMIHYTVHENEKLVKIRALIHSRSSPSKWIK